MPTRLRKKTLIAAVIALLAAGALYLHLRATLLAKDISEMNQSPLWKTSSLVLLHADEREALRRFTEDKHSNWHKFFTLAGGMTVRQVIERGQAML